jgi:hypothetical protein
VSCFNFSSNTLLMRLRGLKKNSELLVVRLRFRRDPRTNTCPQHYGHISVLRPMGTRQTSVRHSSNKINKRYFSQTSPFDSICASHRLCIKNTAVMVTVDGTVPNISVQITT